MHCFLPTQSLPTATIPKTHLSTNVNTVLGLGEDDVSSGVRSALENGDSGDSTGTESSSTTHCERVERSEDEDEAKRSLVEK